MSRATHKIMLKSNSFQDLMQFPFLREAIVLSHIMNALRSSQRYMLSTSGLPASPTSTRDTIHGLLSTVSFVYEGIETSAGILGSLAGSMPKELHKDIAWVIKEKTNPESLFNNVLGKIRNRITFHFGIQIGDSLLNDSVKQYPPQFAEGTSSRTIDWSYTLADDVVTQLLAVYDSSAGSPQEKITRLLCQLSEYNVRLGEVLDRVIANLISKGARFDTI